MSWVKTGSATVSAASSVSIDNCFSTTYFEYVILTRLIGSVADTGFTVNMRSGGSDDTSSNYNRAFFRGISTTPGASRAKSTTSWSITGYTKTTAPTYHMIRLNRPAEAHPTGGLNYYNFDPWGNIEIYIQNLLHSVASPMDGITIKAQSGTITGSVVVYGLKETQ